MYGDAVIDECVQVVVMVLHVVVMVVVQISQMDVIFEGSVFIIKW